MKTLTHIAKVRLEHMTQSEQVMHLLGWTWGQYTDHQFEEYIRFLDRMYDGYSAVRMEMAYSPVFRGFWINEWMGRDVRDWLPMALDCRDNHALVYEEYLHVHSAIRLMGDEEFLAKYEQLLKAMWKGGAR